MSIVSFFDAEFQPSQPLGVGLEKHQLIYTIGSRTECVECCIVIDKGLVTGVQSGDILVSVNGVSLINNNAFPDGQALQCCRQLLMENIHATRNVRFLRIQRKLGPDQDVFDSTVVTLNPGEASLIFDEVKRMEYERRTREKSKVLLAQREKQQQQQQSILMGNNMGRNGSSNQNHNNHTYQQSPIPPTLSSTTTPTSSASASASASAAYNKSVPDPRIENEVQQRVARESLRMDEELKRVKQEADAMKAQVEAMKRAALLAMAADEEEEHAYKSMQGMHRDDLAVGMEIPQRERSSSTSVTVPSTGYGTQSFLTNMQGHNTTAATTTTTSLPPPAVTMEGMMEKSQREKTQQQERELRDLRERIEHERYQRERSMSTSSSSPSMSLALPGTGYGFSAGGGFGGVAGGGNATSAMVAMEYAERERERQNSRDRAISISSAQSDSSGRADATAAMIAMEKAAVRAMEEEATRLAEQTRRAHMKREQLLEQQRRLEMVDSELTRARRDTTDEYVDQHGQRDRDNRDDRGHLRDHDEFEREEAGRERQELVQRTKREALRLLRDQEERNELRQRELEEQQGNHHNNASRDSREWIGRDHRREYDDERELRDNRERERERDRQYPRNHTISTNSAQADSSSRNQFRELRDREMDREMDHRMPLPPPSTNATGSNQRRNSSSNSTNVTHSHPMNSPLVARGTAALTFADHDDDNDNHMHATQPPQQQPQQQQQSQPVNRQPSLSPSTRMEPPRLLAPSSSNYNPGIEPPSQFGLLGPSAAADPSTGHGPPDGPEIITGPHVFQISYGPPGPIGVTLYPFTLTTTHEDQPLSFYAAIVFESRGSPSIQRGDVMVSVNGAPLIAETSQVPRRSRDGAPDGEKHVEVVKNMIVSATAPNRPRVFRFFRCETIDASQPVVHLSEEEAMILLEGYQRP